MAGSRVGSMLPTEAVWHILGPLRVVRMSFRQGERIRCRPVRPTGQDGMQSYLPPVPQKYSSANQHYEANSYVSLPY